MMTSIILLQMKAVYSFKTPGNRIRVKLSCDFFIFLTHV